MPPMREIGAESENMRFFFIVKTVSGVELEPVSFSIKVLPINNKVIYFLTSLIKFA